MKHKHELLGPGIPPSLLALPEEIPLAWGLAGTLNIALAERPC
jgi:hypothetical protein